MKAAEFVLEVNGTEVRFTFLVVFATFLMMGCDSADPEPDPIDGLDVKVIEPSAQRTGDPVAGYEYLVTGNYVGRGIPLDIFNAVPIFGGASDNVLQRTGANADLPPEFTAVTAPNGVRMAAPNCLSCHGQSLNSTYIVGLGNAVRDFTQDSGSLLPLLDAAIRARYGADSPEWNAYQPFRLATGVVGPEIVTDVIGVNPADKLTFVLTAHRDPVTLEWSEERLYDRPEPVDRVIPTDVPAWWLMRKKNAMFYTALGRGDFARISMAASLLTLQDTTEARQIDDRFADVVAYIRSLEPPPYPEAVDQALAEKGRVVFEQMCSTCHGQYGANEVYPNLLVSLEAVGTDPALAENYGRYAELIDVYNGSWFGQGPHAARMVPELGYVAPPLDGIWATAPYLHNGSVPTVEALLNSPTRPTYWRRSFDTSDYDYASLGWNYTEETGPGNERTYDTTLPGYGNAGHIFGDALTDAERRAVIEYLKTL